MEINTQHINFIISPDISLTDGSLRSCDCLLVTHINSQRLAPSMQAVHVSTQIQKCSTVVTAPLSTTCGHLHTQRATVTQALYYYYYVVNFLHESFEDSLL